MKGPQPGRKWVGPLLTVIPALGLFLMGCAGVNFLPGQEPLYLVIRGGAAFWTFGPQQTGGPDKRLDLGDQVAIVRWESGFSRVQLESGTTGFVANEDLAVAPPGTPRRVRQINKLLPRAPQRTAPDDLEEPAGAEARPRPSRPYDGPIVDDAPLPLPEPDLDATPDDAPLPLPSE